MGRGESNQFMIYQAARRQRTEQSRHGPRRVKSIHDLSKPGGRGQNNRDMGRGESNQFMIYQAARWQRTEQSSHGPRRVKSIHDLSSSQVAEDRTIETWAEESQINS
ncbi:hypothetical protein ACJMK2_007291 [Sinanodonta woodiana]|uniref:Uncharacterized protein n=1 Tax=Sinanodonta woodiana TaxID=1069815 RepID=A0ABD3VJM7_SINWO